MTTKKKKQDELYALKIQLEVLQRKQSRLNNKINNLASEIELPRLKKNYEGKYFKYNNGYNAEDRWWLYLHCKEVKGMYKFITDRFETDTWGKSEFAVAIEERGTSSFQVRITKREYDAALRKFKSKLNKL